LDIVLEERYLLPKLGSFLFDLHQVVKLGLEVEVLFFLVLGQQLMLFLPLVYLPLQLLLLLSIFCVFG